MIVYCSRSRAQEDQQLFPIRLRDLGHKSAVITSRNEVLNNMSLVQYNNPQPLIFTLLNVLQLIDLPLT